MRRVGFEPTIPVFLRVKTFPALDRAANVIGEVEDNICRKRFRPASSSVLATHIGVKSSMLLTLPSRRAY
jgi:hypothetical protein